MRDEEELRLSTDDTWRVFLVSRWKRRKYLRDNRKRTSTQWDDLKREGLRPISGQEMLSRLNGVINQHPEHGLGQVVIDAICVPRNPFETGTYRKLKPIVVFNLVMGLMLLAWLYYCERWL